MAGAHDADALADELARERRGDDGQALGEAVIRRRAKPARPG
jgi:hypothetical protein